ncbi:MAG: ankyrin repeat domain-containing protein [Azonexus sp.]|nr:ankyrin repeat domain-containing protein [Azonexus sp.]MCK6410813.1 ankyrin repeat domain-containing protein [Azonexus sp.]
MKHPLFAAMGKDYPIHLETQYERILIKIEELWGMPLIEDYFSDLLIDKRGGRQGFPSEVVKDIVKLREYHEVENFRAAERKEDAAQRLVARKVMLTGDAFLRAFRAGNQELVDLFIRAGFKPPPTDEGIPLLLAALRRGHTVVAKIMIEAGADVNARDNLGLTPLLVACGKTTPGYRVIAERLIARKAQLNVRDVFGFTPLMLAISGGMFDIARLLIERGADLGAISRKGETALNLLQASNAPEKRDLINLMIEHGLKG